MNKIEVKTKKRYSMNIEKELYDRFQKASKSEYKLVNVKLIELIYNFVKDVENK